MEFWYQMEIGENLWRIRGINVDKKYFAYGICVNAESFKRVMRIAGCEDKFRICGVGTLNNYRLTGEFKKLVV